MELSTDPVGARLERPGAGLLIDLDGTLVLTEAANQSAFRQYFAGRGWQVPDDVVRAFAGRRADEVFASLEGPWGDEEPRVLMQEVLDVLGSMDIQPAAVPGAERLLAGCLATALPVAVVTSARRERTAAALRALHVPDGTIGLVTGEDCTHGKPDPEPFRRGAELLGLDPAGLVAVEDTPAGIASAVAAGVGLVVGVTTGHPAQTLVRAGARTTVADLTSLADAVLRRRHQESP